jgi:hypothetical protein
MKSAVDLFLRSWRTCLSRGPARQARGETALKYGPAPGILDPSAGRLVPRRRNRSPKGLAPPSAPTGSSDADAAMMTKIKLPPASDRSLRLNVLAARRWPQGDKGAFVVADLGNVYAIGQWRQEEVEYATQGPGSPSGMARLTPSTS